MGTPASLLDIIARGGPIVGYDASQASQASTALTRAQIPVEQARVPVEQARVPLIRGQVEAQRAATQRTQLENMEIQRQLDASKVLSQIYQEGLNSSPAPGTTPGIVNGPGGPPSSMFSNPMALANEAMKRGVFPQYAIPLAQQMITLGSNAAKLTAEQRQNANAVDERVGSILQQVRALPPEQRAAAVQSDIPILESLDPSTPWRNFDLTNDADLARLETAKVLHGTALAQAKTVQETKTSAAQAGEAAATEQQRKAEAAKLEYENNLLKRMTVPGTAEADAEQIAPAAQYPDIHRQLVAEMQTAGSAPAIQEAKKTASAAVLARTPQTVAAKAGEAAAIKRATGPIEEAQAKDLEAYRNSLSQGDTVKADYYKSLADMHSSLSTADTIQKVLDLSKQGNAVAGAQLKAMVPEFTNAVQNIRRMAASQGDKGLASTADHLSSEAASLLEGKPLSDNVQNEIAPYVQTIANGAVNQHNATVKSLKQAYPKQATGLAEEKQPYKSQAAPAAGTVEGGYRFKGGDPSKQENWEKIQ